MGTKDIQKTLAAMLDRLDGNLKQPCTFVMPRDVCETYMNYIKDLIVFDHVAPIAIVANTEKLGERGSHWVGFYSAGDTDKRRAIKFEFFDSFAMPQSSYGFPSGTSEAVVRRRLQRYDSTLCGGFVLLWLWYKIHGWKSSKILHEYFRVDNVGVSDQSVISYLNGLKLFKL